MPSHRRPDRRTPSAWEASFLEDRQLSLATLEFGLPFELASSQEFLAYGADGKPMSAVYSSKEFGLLPIPEGPRYGSIESYILPHLPLGDAAALRDAGAGGARFRIANLPRLEAKLAARNKLLGVTREMVQFHGSLQQLLPQLVHHRAKVAGLLNADADTELGKPAARLEHFQTEEMQDMMSRWEQDLQRARAAATAARRRLILAVHHATILFVSDNVHAGEDVHDTLLMLAPELHERLFGDPCHADPCSEPLVQDGQWKVREKRTDVAIQQFMRSVGMEMKPEEFVVFSLARSRRDIVESEGEITRQELRLSVMRPIQDVLVAVGSLQDVRNTLKDHFTYPTLLGNQGTTLLLCFLTYGVYVLFDHFYFTINSQVIFQPNPLPLMSSAN